MSKQTLIIYLAHLDHPNYVDRIAVPYNIACIASYCKSKFGKEIEISLFTNVEDLMETMRTKPPHILGLSYYMWNVNLVKQVIECCRQTNPEIITVIGGPSVSRISDSYKKLLAQNIGLDIVSLDHGEKTFAEIIHRTLSVGMNKKNILDNPIAGCVSRHNGSKSIAKGSDIVDMKGLEKTPSPYLEGYLDQFLAVGQWPMLETNRGCPYACTFCERGDTYFNKLMIRDEDTIYEELRYLAKYSKVRKLIITDSNFGIMGERDLRIIQKIEEMHHSINFPSMITDVAAPKAETKYAIESMKAVSRVSGRYYYGLQTLTDMVLESSKRKNISLGTIQQLAQIAREDNRPVTVDLIFGLPGETVQSFMDTTSELISLGIQPSIYNLRVLSGTEIAEGDREKYKYKTMFRPFNNRYGEYQLMPNEKPFRIIETEEIAYENTTITSDDYMFIRQYSFLIELMSTFGCFTDALIFLGAKGITVADINQYILSNHSSYPRLASLFEEYVKHSNDELGSSEDELLKRLTNHNEWNDLIRQEGRYFKVNMGFAGYCLLGDTKMLADFELMILEYVKPRITKDELVELNEVFKVCRQKRVIPERSQSWDINSKLEPSHIQKDNFVEENYDYSKWLMSNCKDSLSSFRHDKPVKKNYQILEYDELVEIIEQCSEYSGYNYYEKILLGSCTVIAKRSKIDTPVTSPSF
jgi:radical SAM superfamily enzyme YgiQ (UPF0313 family)